MNPLPTSGQSNASDKETKISRNFYLSVCDEYCATPTNKISPKSLYPYSAVFKYYAEAAESNVNNPQPCPDCVPLDTKSDIQNANAAKRVLPKCYPLQTCAPAKDTGEELSTTTAGPTVATKTKIVGSRQPTTTTTVRAEITRTKPVRVRRTAAAGGGQRVHIPVRDTKTSIWRKGVSSYCGRDWKQSSPPYRHRVAIDFKAQPRPSVKATESSNLRRERNRRKIKEMKRNEDKKPPFR